MKVRNKLFATMIMCLFVVGILPVAALATSQIDLEQNASITIDYPVSDTKFDIYRIADVSSQTVEFTLTPEFAVYPVQINDLDSNGWRDMAQTLDGYVMRDELQANASATTDSEGKLTFSALKPGLYLVLGQTNSAGEYTYIPEPFLVSIPSKDETSNMWTYDVSVTPKYERIPVPSDNESITRKVLKVWEDSGNTDKRPEKVVIQLLCDGKVFDTVMLDAGNNWRYTWENLSANSKWSVVERNSDGYTVAVSREGITFVVTNTFSGTNGTPTPDNPSSPSLPQTGVLWWPVLVLAAFGLFFIVIGWIIRRGENREA